MCTFDFLVVIDLYDYFHMCLAAIWQFLGLGGGSKGNRNYHYL